MVATQSVLLTPVSSRNRTGLKEFAQSGSGYTGRFQNSFTTLKAYINLFTGHVQYYVAKHNEFYMGYLRCNVTATGNAGCFQNSFTMLSKCCFVASVTKKFTLKGVQTIHRSTNALMESSKRQMFPFLWVPELSPCLSNSQLTNSQH
jgi:hypothetical protein